MGGLNKIVETDESTVWQTKICDRERGGERESTHLRQNGLLAARERNKEMSFKSWKKEMVGNTLINVNKRYLGISKQCLTDD